MLRLGNFLVLLACLAKLSAGQAFDDFGQCYQRCTAQNAENIVASVCGNIPSLPELGDVTLSFCTMLCLRGVVKCTGTCPCGGEPVTELPTEPIQELPTELPDAGDECNAPIRSWLGDGWCDRSAAYNNAACNWDGGDCCEETCVPAEGQTFSCGITGFDCRNPEFQNSTTTRPRRAVNNALLTKKKLSLLDAKTRPA